jgi:hypothetical protein
MDRQIVMLFLDIRSKDKIGLNEKMEVQINSVKNEIISCFSKRRIKSKIKPIFFMQLDKCVKLYPMLNFPLQEISNSFPVYFVCSGTKDDDYVDKLRCFYPKAHFIECPENSNLLKNKIFFDTIKNKEDYDVVVRTCMDSLIVDVELLLKILEKQILGKFSLIGNAVFNNNSIHYIRGGCHAYTKSFVKHMNSQHIWNQNFNNKEFDIEFTELARKYGVELIPYELFFLGPPIKKECPVCHPEKGIRYKSNRYLSILEEWVVLENKMQSKDYLRIQSLLQTINQKNLIMTT